MIKSKSLLDFKTTVNPTTSSAATKTLATTSSTTMTSRPKVLHFQFTIGSYDDFVEASRPSKCLTFEEFCASWHEKNRPKCEKPGPSDYLTQGLNACALALRYLPHKKIEIESIRRQLSLLTFSKDTEALIGLLRDLEKIGARVFWPGAGGQQDEPDHEVLKEKYTEYLENEASKEYFNRKNLRLYNESSLNERILM